MGGTEGLNVGIGRDKYQNNMDKRYRAAEKKSF